MKIKTAISAAALVAAVATISHPAVAGEDDGLINGRVQRNWSGQWSGQGNSGGQRAAAQASNSARTGGHTAAASTRAPSVASTSDDDEDSGRRPAAGGGRGRGGGEAISRYDSQFDLDPAEAARIREAHREAEYRGHVTLRRDDDGWDDVPSYSTPPRRHWYSWW